MSKARVGTNGVEKETVALCASCDRCRSRKTRCDGNRPCGNCASKYLKKNKLSSIEGIDIELFECVYSPAKRRGPVPGRSGQVRKASQALEESTTGLRSGVVSQNPQSATDDAALLQQRQMLLAQHTQAPQPLQAHLSGNEQAIWGGGLDPSSAAGAGVGGTASINAQQQVIQQQLNYIQQLQDQQNQLTAAAIGKSAVVGDTLVQPSNQRQRLAKTEEKADGGVPRSIRENLHLLQRDSRDGNRLRAYYQLSIDELFGLPPIPTDEEYCATLNIPMSPRVLPQSHQAALMSGRFAEVALGALVHNEVALAIELSNATVLLLKECVLEEVKLSYAYEVARAYFLLGCFRAFRGDLERYFKYRRVCMKHLTKLDVANHTGAELLLAGMSFFDSWAYMMHNADEKKLPSIDDTIPPVQCSSELGSCGAGNKYGVPFDPKGIVSDPKNQMWIQGAPPVFLNNNAPLTARSLDALACAVRTCCDQANTRFAEIASSSKGEASAESEAFDPITPTCSAVMANEDELCSRNMVLSAYTLLQQEEAGNPVPFRNQGHHLVISAMDAFLENSDDDGSGGFTDSQIQSLLTVCNTTVENPFLLHHGGPTYHMVSNAAILLCHLLNGMYATQSAEGDENGRKAMEAAVFEEVYDTFISVRKLLNIHRRKLPVVLRCHGIPRPSIKPPSDNKPFIDLGETLMCACRGCQGFVLMACSPCVAAERARAANQNREMEISLEAAEEKADFDKELLELETEFDLDDDQLLNMLSRIVSA